MSERSLLSLAKARFSDLESNPAEVQLIQKASTGDPLNLDTVGLYVSATENADTGPHQWGHDHDIRAELVRWLATDSESSQLLDCRGIQVKGVRIVGFLNLESAVMKNPISFTLCRLGLVSIARASLPGFTLFACWCTDLTANLVKVKGGLSLAGSILDSVALANSQVDLLYCSGTSCAKFFRADHIHVTGNVELNARRIFGGLPTPFRSLSGVSLYEASIGGDLELTGGKFGSTEFENTQTSILLQSASIKGSIVMGTPSEGFGEPSYPPDMAEYMEASGAIDLRGATAGTFALDQIYSDWPQKWKLEDFRYDKVHLLAKAFPDSLSHGLSPNAALGLWWLAMDLSGSIQPYEQFSNVLESMGDLEGAKQVRKALEKLLSERNDRWATRRLKASIGYGYDPGNAIWGLGAVTLLGWLLYWRSYRMGMMVPTDKDASESFRSSRTLPSNYPRFYSLIYSLENTFPLVKLGLGDKWQPNPESKSRFILRFRWFQILIGWLLAALFAAAISGLIRTH